MRLNGQVLGERDFDLITVLTKTILTACIVLVLLGLTFPVLWLAQRPKLISGCLEVKNVNSEYPIEEHNWVIAAELPPMYRRELTSLRSVIMFLTIHLPIIAMMIFMQILHNEQSRRCKSGKRNDRYQQRRQ